MSGAASVASASAASGSLLPVYLQRVFPEGLLLVVLFTHHTYLCCDLYVMHSSSLIRRSHSSPHQPSSSPSLLSNLSPFVAICCRIKDGLHVNSFLYDFHLRQISANFLQDILLSPPSVSDNGFPARGEESMRRFYPPQTALFTLRALDQLYGLSGPKYARSRLIGCEVCIPFVIPPSEQRASSSPSFCLPPVTPETLFSFITTNAEQFEAISLKRYGFDPALLVPLSSLLAPPLASLLQREDEDGVPYVVVLLLPHRSLNTDCHSDHETSSDEPAVDVLSPTPGEYFILFSLAIGYSLFVRFGGEGPQRLHLQLYVVLSSSPLSTGSNVPLPSRYPGEREEALKEILPMVSTNRLSRSADSQVRKLVVRLVQHALYLFKRCVSNSHSSPFFSSMQRFLLPRPLPPW